MGKGSAEWMTETRIGGDALSVIDGVTDKKTRELCLRVYGAILAAIEGVINGRPTSAPPDVFAEWNDEFRHGVVIGISSSGARGGIVVRPARRKVAWFYVSHSSVGGRVASGESDRTDIQAVAEIIAKLVMECG